MHRRGFFALIGGALARPVVSPAGAAPPPPRPGPLTRIDLDCVAFGTLQITEQPLDEAGALWQHATFVQLADTAPPLGAWIQIDCWCGCSDVGGHAPLFVGQVVRRRAIRHVRSFGGLAWRVEAETPRRRC